MPHHASDLRRVVMSAISPLHQTTDGDARTDVLLYLVAGTALSSDEMIDFMERYAHAHEWNPCRVVEDQDRLHVLDRRPGWAEVVAAITTRTVRGVLVPEFNHLVAGRSELGHLRAILRDRGAFLRETGLPSECGGHGPVAVDSEAVVQSYERASGPPYVPPARTLTPAGRGRIRDACASILSGDPPEAFLEFDAVRKSLRYVEDSLATLVLDVQKKALELHAAAPLRGDGLTAVAEARRQLYAPPPVPANAASYMARLYRLAPHCVVLLDHLDVLSEHARP
ncbi:recombinase family protein [Streptomyces sp. NPDC001941]|uniref:recombinase family protein n=1 Tax=Streptomyces sp. NPDC001941 TaxID=3154659 RepID=UPI00331D1E7C